MRILALAFLLVSASPQKDTSSNGRKPEEPAKTQQSATQDQRGTKRAPLIVQPLAPRLNHEQADDETAEKADKAWNELVTAFSTLVIAVFTVLLALYTAKLFGSGERTFKHLQDSSRRELRAYVFPKKVRPITNPPMNELAGYAVTLWNTGKTPAYDMVVWSRVDIASPKSESDEYWKIESDPLPSRAPIAPGTTVRHQTVPTAFTTEQQALLDAGGIVYLHGVVEYRDAFGKDHWTRFRFMRSHGDHQMITCAGGNGADESPEAD